MEAKQLSKILSGDKYGEEIRVIVVLGRYSYENYSLSDTFKRVVEDVFNKKAPLSHALSVVGAGIDDKGPYIKISMNGFRNRWQKEDNEKFLMEQQRKIDEERKAKGLSNPKSPEADEDIVTETTKQGTLKLSDIGLSFDKLLASENKTPNNETREH